MKLAFLAAMALLAIAALAFRVRDIGNRPMHGDEAVHAEKFRELWEHGVYRYDSNEYHGPTIYYAALPSVIVHGRRSWQDTREADYRLPVAVFGAAMILLLIPLGMSLGRPAACTAGLLLAISPAFVFYSRYFIQEVPFVFFTLALIVCGWRYFRARSSGWLVGAGLSAGLMVATKETAVLSFASALMSIWLTMLWARRIDRGADDDAGTSRQVLSIRAAAIAFSIALVTACAFLTGFGVNLRGPLDYLRSYAPWFHRAQGASMQNHPFLYYLRILVWSHIHGGAVWSELLIVALAIVGAVCALRRKADSYQSGVHLCRFLTFYTLTLTFIYSAIPYKTPWCVLSFLLGMCLLAGVGAAEIVGVGEKWSGGERGSGRAGDAKTRLRMICVSIVLVTAMAQLTWQSYRTSFIAYADPHNPYVYAATATDILDLKKRIDDLANYWPEHRNMVIKVFAPGSYYWPLPWYLRSYPNVGYYAHAPISKEEAAAAVTLCDRSLEEVVDPLLSEADLMNGYNEVRNGVFYDRYIRMDVWTAYLTGKNGGVVPHRAPPPPE